LAMRELGIPVKSHMAGVDPETAEMLKEYFAEKSAESQAAGTAEPQQVVKEAPPKKTLVLQRCMAVEELAARLDAPVESLVALLRSEGKEVPATRVLDVDTTVRLASKMGYNVQIEERPQDALIKIARESDQQRRDVGPRAPVVTIMGHVDHGKTTILDEIRKSKITEAEPGAITQHIGAYYVKTPRGDVVFLDTPGHQAFTAMRARGAHVTDIVVLVVAVDDGVMPQTQEAIRHAQDAGVPIIVALNKIDKAKQNVEKVKRSLAQFGLIPEEEGGETIFVPTSATQRIGLETLLEMIVLVAEMMELRAAHKGPAKGVVIESRVDRGKGPVATVLVQEGLLRRGDLFVAGITSGKVRAMMDDRGRTVKEAGPSMPVEVMGFDALAEAGDAFYVIPKGRKAKEYLESLEQLQREEDRTKPRLLPREPLLAVDQQEEAKLKLILKVDVYGSLGAISNAILGVAKGDIEIEIIHSGVGSVTKADVSLAAIAGAQIIGFGIRLEPQIAAFAKQQGVKIKVFDVIYTLLDYVESLLRLMEKPTLVEETLGTAEVRAVFSIPSAGKVAGCFVQNGRVVRDANARVFRNGQEIYEGRIASLKRFKKDVKEVQTNFDCGIGLQNFQDIEVGDIIECYHVVERAPE